MDGRGPTQIRAGDPGDSAHGHDRPAGTNDGHDRSAAKGRAQAGLVDADHASSLVASGAGWLHLAAAASHVPALQTVWCRLHRWRELAVLDRALAVLVVCLRLARGRKRRPTAAIIDTQSVRTGPQRGPYDAAKKVKGRKRVLLVDVEGDPLGIQVVPADRHEHRALCALAPDLAAHPTLRLIWLDRGFAGDAPELFLNGYGIAVEIVGIKKRQGFQIEPRRGKAEQTFGCLQRYRRLRVDDEMSCESSRGMTMLVALFMTGMRLEHLISS
jgi:putative transposase